MLKSTVEPAYILYGKFEGKNHEMIFQASKFPLSTPIQKVGNSILEHLKTQELSGALQ